MARYDYKQITPSGTNAGTALLQLLKTTLGADYEKWKTDSRYDQVLQFAHEVIFNDTGKYRGGLKLRPEFLFRAKHQTSDTKRGHPCYNDVLIDALAAGVISAEKYRELNK